MTGRSARAPGVLVPPWLLIVVAIFPMRFRFADIVQVTALLLYAPLAFSMARSGRDNDRSRVVFSLVMKAAVWASVGLMVFQRVAHDHQTFFASTMITFVLAVEIGRRYRSRVDREQLADAIDNVLRVFAVMAVAEVALGKNVFAVEQYFGTAWLQDTVARDGEVLTSAKLLFSGPNIAAQVVVLLQIAKGRLDPRRLVDFPSWVPAIIATLLTFSRGGMAGLCILGLGVLASPLADTQRRATWLMATATGAVLGLGGALASGFNPLQRLVAGETLSDADNREGLVVMAFDLARTRPLTGWGEGTFFDAVRDEFGVWIGVGNPHNIVALWAYAYGLIAGLLLTYVLVAALRKSVPNDPQTRLIGVVGVVVIALFCAAYETVAYPPVFPLLGLVIGFSAGTSTSAASPKRVRRVRSTGGSGRGHVRAAQTRSAR